MSQTMDRWRRRISLLMAVFVTANTFLLFPQGVAAATTSFSLNPNGTSHIGWMFPDSSWDSRNGWKLVTNSAKHVGTDYYADDWNWGDTDQDCGKEVRAPFAGNVIFKGWGTNNNGTANGYGYQVIIQADANTNFA